MTKQEFERRMERARKRVLKPRKGEPGVCDILGDIVHEKAEEVFYRNFSPKQVYDPDCYCFEAGYWLGDYFPCDRIWNRNDSMTQLERRLVFLESFKGFCNAHELWREW